MEVSEASQGFGVYAAKSGKEVKLAMQDLHLSGTLLPVGGRLVVRHVFRSAEKRAVEVVYSFMLPRDAAMRRFRVLGEGFESHSELRPVKEANDMYEKGIDRGHLAVLARAYGDGVVNLNVGNIRPGETITVLLEIAAGVELHDDGFRFRFPFTLAPGYHAQASAAEIAPGVGEMSLPADLFGDMVLPEWHADARGLHRVGFDLCVEAPGGALEVASPSHNLTVRQEDTGTRAGLAVAADIPNRDLVLDVRYRDNKPVALAGTDSEGRGRFVVIVPSTCFGEPKHQPKRIVFLLDRSGSMGGSPMEQAKKAIEACLGALGEDDRFSIVAFDTECEKLPGFAPATMAAREDARRFLQGIDARGGTELAAGVNEAAQVLGSEGGEILLLTDGQVFGGENIIASAKRTGIRIHCLGIGSASQDRFLSQIASETGGTGRFVTPRERVDVAVLEVFAGIGSPAATDVVLESAANMEVHIAPESSGTVFAGTPYVGFGSFAGTGGRLHIKWNGEDEASMELPLLLGDGSLGEVVKLLQGARLTSAAELQVEPNPRRAHKRNAERVERQLTDLANEYGLANRAMALVAVVQRKGDKAGELPTMQVVPVGMPEDVEMYSRFRSLSSPDVCCSMAPPAAFMPDMCMSSSSVAESLLRKHREYAKPFREMAPMTGQDLDMDTLLAIASAVEADGGMPGCDDNERSAFTLLALLAFYEAGNTAASGPFAAHVRRLCGFLDKFTVSGLDPEQQEIFARVREAILKSSAVSGPWLKLARKSLSGNAKASAAEIWKAAGKSI